MGKLDLFSIQQDARICELLKLYHMIYNQKLHSGRNRRSFKDKKSDSGRQMPAAKPAEKASGQSDKPVLFGRRRRQKMGARSRMPGIQRSGDR